MATETKAIYQFDDDSLLKFAQAIANAVASTYLRKSDLKAAIEEIIENDPDFLATTKSESTIRESDMPVGGIAK